MKAKECVNYISKWLSDYLTQSKLKGYVVGVSGGIDSAVTSTLVAQTGFPVLCLELPILQEQHQIVRAKEHIAWLENRFENAQSLSVDLSSVFQNFEQVVTLDDNTDSHFISLVNAKARLRMTTLYYYAQLYSFLVVGTGNKVEDFGIGFFTKYGDGGVDISPIADLLKSEVYTLGDHLGIVDSIMSAPPTDGLWNDDRTDQEQIGATYDELEWAMSFLGEAENLSDRQQFVLKKFHQLNAVNKHKMHPIPVCVIPNNLK